MYSNLTKVVKHFHYTEAILRDFFTASAVTTILISTKGGANRKDKSFDLVMATLQDADSGETVFTRPLFIAITGEFKSEVSTWEAYKEYLQRFDVEKTYRFSNQPVDERFSDL